MKNYVVLKVACVIMMMVTSNFSLAGTLEVNSLYLDSVTIVGVAAFGHQAGSLEIKITNGMGNPAGINCDKNYITTKNTAPNFQAMVSVLLTAQTTQKPLRLGITDDPTLTAFIGRCSLVSVTILK